MATIEEFSPFFISTATMKSPQHYIMVLTLAILSATPYALAENPSLSTTRCDETGGGHYSRCCGHSTTTSSGSNTCRIQISITGDNLGHDTDGQWHIIDNLSKSTLLQAHINPNYNEVATYSCYVEPGTQLKLKYDTTSPDSGSDDWDFSPEKSLWIKADGTTVLGTSAASNLNSDFVFYCDETTSAPTTASPSTLSPTTLAPTSRPSDSPTASPTTQPIVSPTSTPSLYPTVTPTKFPTAIPSGFPTIQPSLTPSRPLSSQPACTSSNSPTVTTSTSPSMSPTISPTWNLTANDSSPVTNSTDLDTTETTTIDGIDSPRVPHFWGIFFAIGYIVTATLAMDRYSKLQNVKISSSILYVVNVLKCLAGFGFSFYTFITQVMGGTESGSNPIKLIMLLTIFASTYASQSATLTAFSNFDTHGWSSTPTLNYVKRLLQANAILAMLLCLLSLLSYLGHIVISIPLFLGLSLAFVIISGIVFASSTTYLSILIKNGWSYGPTSSLTQGTREHASKRLFLGGLIMSSCQILSHSLYVVSVSIFSIDILNEYLIISVLLLDITCTWICIQMFVHEDVLRDVLNVLNPKTTKNSVTFQDNVDIVIQGIGDDNCTVSRNPMGA